MAVIPVEMNLSLKSGVLIKTKKPNNYGRIEFEACKRRTETESSGTRKKPISSAAFL
jgi:hypothetical protein